eukprot:CAMPEP_0183411314 /NCGR_PEP_ID=MMETSP0370-20130417/20228_1 /TAXON_ID=268820 /ORGANISM="Peridinium aciculiferum, Strain PAER-2" /LENGTH=58 /DNA_ID=CAMNT_0025594279 /DNA_START=145 /DNA_END=317 /DNA_ORIENTATION=-
MAAAVVVCEVVDEQLGCCVLQTSALHFEYPIDGLGASNCFALSSCPDRLTQEGIFNRR